MLELVFAKYNYWIVIVLMMIGLYVVISRGNLVKQIIGLNVFKTSVFLLYISMGKVAGGTPPILPGKDEVFSNPIPHLQILNASVVGLATPALGMGMVVRIRSDHPTIPDNNTRWS